MSEGVQASPDVPRGGSRIRDPRDFYGGLALIALGVFALWASRDLPGMHGFAFGPGTAPRMFAIVLIGLGAVIAGMGLITEGAAVERYEITGPTLINLAYILVVSAQTFSFKMVALAVLVLGVILSVIGLMSARRNLVRGPLFIHALRPHLCDGGPSARARHCELFQHLGGFLCDPRGTPAGSAHLERRSVGVLRAAVSDRAQPAASAVADQSQLGVPAELPLTRGAPASKF